MWLIKVMMVMAVGLVCLSGCSTSLNAKNANYQSDPPYSASDYGYVTTYPPAYPSPPFLSRPYPPLFKSKSTR